ncbi:MAG: aminopeptidase [archaeon]|jgi:hypothetical protein
MISIDDSTKIKNIKPLTLQALQKVFDLYEITPKSNVLLWSNTSKNKVSEKLAKTFLQRLNQLGCTTSVIIEKEKTKLGPASKKTQKCILSLTQGDIFISIGAGNRGYVEQNGKHVLMRKLMKKQGFRMVSLGGLDSIKLHRINSFFESFNHNQKEINSLNKKIKNLLEKTKTIKITCPKGSNLTMELNKNPVISNDGNWKKYSTNYPIGEVYTAPKEDSCNGIAFVSSAKVSGKTILPKKPIKFIFEKGLLKSTNSKEINSNLKYVEKFNKKNNILNWKTAPRTIAEFAIGTNRKASIVGAMICDEKTLGTCHFAIGNNKHLGGKTYCHGHFDNVIKNPTIWFDGKKIMTNGKLLF